MGLHSRSHTLWEFDSVCDGRADGDCEDERGDKRHARCDDHGGAGDAHEHTDSGNQPAGPVHRGLTTAPYDSVVPDSPARFPTRLRPPFPGKRRHRWRTYSPDIGAETRNCLC